MYNVCKYCGEPGSVHDKCLTDDVRGRITKALNAVTTRVPAHKHKGPVFDPYTDEFYCDVESMLDEVGFPHTLAYACIERAAVISIDDSIEEAEHGTCGNFAELGIEWQWLDELREVIAKFNDAQTHNKYSVPNYALVVDLSAYIREW